MASSDPRRAEQNTPRSLFWQRHGVPEDVFPRLAVESNALLFPSRPVDRGGLATCD